MGTLRLYLDFINLAAALSRLHQPVSDAAPPVRLPEPLTKREMHVSCLK